MVRLFVFSLLLVAVFAAYENTENRRRGNEIGNEEHNKIDKSTKTHENNANAEENNEDSKSSSNENSAEETTTGDDTDSSTTESNSDSDSSLSDSSGTVETEEVIDQNNDGRNTYEVEESVDETPCAIHGFQNGCICRAGDLRCINIHQGQFNLT